MGTWTKSTKPRVQNVQALPNGGDELCAFCGEDTRRRNVHLILQYVGGKICPDFPRGAKATKASRFKAQFFSARGVRIGGMLCMGCAKRLASRLDASIGQVLEW